MTSKKIVTLFASLFLLVSLGGYIFWFRPYSAELAADSDAKLLLEIYSSAQRAYSAESGAFALKPEKLAMDTRLKFVKLYFDVADIPKAERSLIPPSLFPFVSDDKFRVIVITSNARTSRPVIWMGDETGAAMKLKGY